MSKLTFIVVPILFTVTPCLSYPSTDSLGAGYTDAYWMSLSSSIAIFEGAGYSLGPCIAFEHRNFVISLRYNYYHVVWQLKKSTEGSIPSPRDYLSDVALLLGISTDKSTKGHTYLSVGPSFGSGLLFEEPGIYEHNPFSSVGFTFEFCHQFNDPLISGISGGGIKLIYERISKHSFFSLQFEIRFGKILKY